MSTLKWRRSNARALHLSGMARLLWFRVDGAMKFIKNEDVSALITSQELRTNINLEIKNGAFEPKTLSEFLGYAQFWNIPASKTWMRNSYGCWKQDESLDHFCSCNLINLGRKQNPKHAIGEVWTQWSCRCWVYSVSTVKRLQCHFTVQNGSDDRSTLT